MTFAYKSHPQFSFILLANRDEFFRRPTAAMHYWSDHPSILAGRDLEQMGTWLGLHTQGKFTAVTNYRDGSRKENNLISRGQLTSDFLQGELSAQKYLESLKPTSSNYGGYNLLTGDSRGLYYHSNQQQVIKKLQPGVYGLSNALLDSPWPKLLKAKAALHDAVTENDLSTERLLPIMQNPETVADEQLPDTGVSLEWERLLSSCFIQQAEYGTRATTIVLQKADGETVIIEQNYDNRGKTEQNRFDLFLPPIGEDD